jgi:uncharacterized protein YbaR (Trm112 family)
MIRRGGRLVEQASGSFLKKEPKTSAIVTGVILSDLVPIPQDPVPLDPRLLEILVCPVTKGPLTYDRAAGELVSRKAGLAYPIRDGIPIMLPEEARRLEE